MFLAKSGRSTELMIHMNMDWFSLIMLKLQWVKAYTALAVQTLVN